MVYSTTRHSPERIAGYWAWPCSGATSEILFVGKGPGSDRSIALRGLAAQAPDNLSWPRQIHSGIARQTDRHGPREDCDALVTSSSSLALSVVTADCLPIIVEGNGHLAAIHAGWRGLVQRIIEATLDRIPGPRHALQAWIGPAVGACCYEVDWDVAHRVAAASDPEVIQTGGDRPHLDLEKAARRQLEEIGVRGIRSLVICTMCEPDWLWSYRRDRPHVGRNWTFAWRRDR